MFDIMGTTSPGFSYEGAQTATSVAVSIFVRVHCVRTNVYIDGFNLYYACLKRSGYKGLDMRRLAESLFPNDQIGRVCYCTSRLEVHNGDGGPRHRQATYLRALQTLRGLDIVTGTFRMRTKRRPLSEPIPGVPPIVSIFEWEEKKTDVNLATEMIFDAYSGTCEQVAVITNDADLSRPLQRIRDDLGISIVIVNPSRKVRTPRDMYQSANRVMRIRDYHLQRSLLPPALIDSQGRTITKPATW